jgi:ribosome-interacting GTPase 1
MKQHRRTRFLSFPQPQCFSLNLIIYLQATEYHLGLLKAKLARYRAQLLEPASKSGPKASGFDVQKSGDARVALIGFPSVGKSTLLGKITHTQSEAAAYEFTTLTVRMSFFQVFTVQIPSY